MKFNTAIFYDIENLLKGYSLGQKIVQGLSLKEVFKQIQATEAISKVAIQRAYANWSDPRLSFMRNELLDLGIEPIQVFGFSYGGNKNVADIQLAVEVTDLIHTHPTIEVFVIVSGDGGYASLAKKLHERGKTVIGGGYKKSTNKVFEAVCDHFVWIEDPDSNSDEVNTNIQISDSRIHRMKKSVQSANIGASSESILQKTKEIVNWMVSDNEVSNDLKLSGISPSVFRDAVGVIIPGFDPIKFGFSKFLEFLRFMLKDTNLGVWQSNKQSSDVKVGFKKKPFKDYSLMPELEARAIHSVEGYKSVLSHGSPSFRLPDYETLKSVAITLQNLSPHNSTIDEILEVIVEISSFNSDQESLKLALFSYISANSFSREPENAKLYEQKLTLRKELASYESLIENLNTELKKKINLALGEFKPDILEEALRENQA